jgi:hypothetical protein
MTSSWLEIFLRGESSLLVVSLLQEQIKILTRWSEPLEGRCFRRKMPQTAPIVENGGTSSYLVYPKTFAITSKDTLIFMASQGYEGGPRTPYLVTINLSGGLTTHLSPHLQNLQYLNEEVGAPINEVLQIDSIEPIGEQSVRLVFANGMYRKSEMRVPIP